MREARKTRPNLEHLPPVMYKIKMTPGSEDQAQGVDEDDTAASPIGKKNGAAPSTFQKEGEPSTKPPGDETVHKKMQEQFKAEADKPPEEFNKFINDTFNGGKENTGFISKTEVHKLQQEIRNPALGEKNGTWPPEVQLGDTKDFDGAFVGGENGEKGQILLNKNLKPEEMANTYWEEMGHAIDKRIRPKGGDAQGDEGAIFAKSLDAKSQGGQLAPADLETLRAENDQGTVSIDGSGPTGAEFDRFAAKLNTDFQNNPTQFMQDATLDFLHTVPPGVTPPQAVTTDANGGGPANTPEVAHFNLNPMNYGQTDVDGTATSPPLDLDDINYSLGHTAVLNMVAPDQVGGTEIPAYYLPFAHHTETGQGVPYIDVSATNPEANFVFTGGLTGCSCFVTQSPEDKDKIRIYHDKKGGAEKLKEGDTYNGQTILGAVHSSDSSSGSQDAVFLNHDGQNWHLNHQTSILAPNSAAARRELWVPVPVSNSSVPIELPAQAAHGTQANFAIPNVNSGSNVASTSTGAGGWWDSVIQGLGGGGSHDETRKLSAVNDEDFVAKSGLPPSTINNFVELYGTKSPSGGTDTHMTKDLFLAAVDDGVVSIDDTTQALKIHYDKVPNQVWTDAMLSYGQRQGLGDSDMTQIAREGIPSFIGHTWEQTGNKAAGPISKEEASIILKEKHGNWPEYAAKDIKWLFDQGLLDPATKDGALVWPYYDVPPHTTSVTKFDKPIPH